MLLHLNSTGLLQNQSWPHFHPVNPTKSALLTEDNVFKVTSIPLSHKIECTGFLIEEKEIQLARAMSDKAIARIKIAAAILGITPKHLHELAKRPDFPAKVRIGSNAIGWRVSDLEAWIDAQIVKGEE